MFEAPEPRRCISRRLDPKDNEAFRRDWRKNFGTPSTFRTSESMKTVYESETDYLDRLHLLTADERAALAMEEDREDARPHGSGAYCGIFPWLEEEQAAMEGEFPR